MLNPKEQRQLLEKLSEVINFRALEDGSDHTSSVNGHAAIEFLPDKTTLFVQLKGMNAVNLAQHSALLHVFLGELLPRWKKSGAWLNQAIAPNITQHFERHKEKRLVTIRTTEAGIFLEVAPK